MRHQTNAFSYVKFVWRKRKQLLCFVEWLFFKEWRSYTHLFAVVLVHEFYKAMVIVFWIIKQFVFVNLSNMIKPPTLLGDIQRIPFGKSSFGTTRGFESFVNPSWMSMYLYQDVLVNMNKNVSNGITVYRPRFLSLLDAQLIILITFSSPSSNSSFCLFEVL